jgi:YjjI family glycine radical enzyme
MKMDAKISDLIQIATAGDLTYSQKLFSLANAAERLVDPIEVLGYTKEEKDFLDRGLICDLNEGHLPYRPRYIVPDYNILVENGCKFLDIQAPRDLDELLDGLLILYKNIPSITSYPVFVGNLDELIEPFITGKEDEFIKIKRFMNHIDKTIPDSFCHGNIGPKDTIAGRYLLRAIRELGNPTPNMTINYSKYITDDDFAKDALKTCLLASKPSFSNYEKYVNDVGDHSIVSCYNALPNSGGAYTLPRLRLGTIARNSKDLETFLNEDLQMISKAQLGIIDKRIKFIVEKSNFFESSFLVKEGFISKENFSAMFGIVGLADAINYFITPETFGNSERGDNLAKQILDKIQLIVDEHEGVYSGRTGNKYLLHAQVGAAITDEDKHNTPAHRIKIGQEPILPLHLNSSMPLHEYFKSGTGDLFAFDRTWLNKTDALLDIVKGAFEKGGRYITTYLEDTDIIRVTGYLVKKSDVEKFRKGEAVLRDTDIFGSTTDENANVFSRKTR